MPAERHSRPLHKVGPSFRDCQGRAHRHCGITSQQSAPPAPGVRLIRTSGCRGDICALAASSSIQALDGPLRDVGITPSEHLDPPPDIGHCHALA
jgi:hypothetical protein